MRPIRRRRKPEGPLSTLRAIDWDTHLQDTSGDTSSLSFVSGFALGLVVGVIVAILLAPERQGTHARSRTNGNVEQ